MGDSAGARARETMMPIEAMTVNTNTVIDFLTISIESTEAEGCFQGWLDLPELTRLSSSAALDLKPRCQHRQSYCGRNRKKGIRKPRPKNRVIAYSDRSHFKQNSTLRYAEKRADWHTRIGFQEIACGHVWPNTQRVAALTHYVEWHIKRYRYAVVDQS